ncbi:interferon regulatory factor 7 isoform X2 [Rhinatrema bivittatum]|uniref:interferon regulatory factor 7 isoform X2 n=1 Tax=Rhinatrema bivittatum TaxID=194408 RepID=UPI00112839D1|nr:interferon regulatory factor 7 isoform X2 [Rhinatrema bivittatum]
MAGNDRHPRQRFRPWLIEQINSKKYEGLCWVDAEHTMFRIQWKHLSRRDSSQKDYELFKAWAIEGGKYNGQCEDPTLWKTNFRCALKSITKNNKIVFSEVANRSSDLHDPHKVYRINCLQDSAAASAHVSESKDAKEQTDHNGLNSEEDDDERLRISPDSEQIPNFTNVLPQPANIMDQAAIEDRFDCMSLENHLAEVTAAREMAVANDHYHQNNVLENELFQPTYNACVQSCVQEQIIPVQNMWNPEIAFHFPGRAFLNLEVTMYYKGRLMKEQKVSSPCLLSYNEVSDPSLSSISAVCFPNPEDLPDQKQVRYTKTLLQNVERGLLLEVEQETCRIYATRRGKCKVFWALSKQLATPAQGLETKLLQREEKTEIFNFHQFWMELRHYKAGQRESPDYTLYLCFGQCFSEQKPKEKKLILVKIVPQFCALLHDLMQREGASSLNSDSLNLQISSSNSLYELIDSCELMDLDIFHL